jgi:replication factor A1
MLKNRELVEQILKQRPDMDEQELERLVDEKRRTVGAGYLTEQGALLLVANDLNVTIKQEFLQKELALRDVYIGANQLTVVGRVFSISPLKEYKRNDGTQGKMRRIVIFDSSSFVTLNLWDDKTELLESLGVRVGSVIRVVKAYVRAGLDGKPVLNLGKRGDIELVSDEKAKKLPTIESLIKDVSEINEPVEHLVIEGEVVAEPRLTEFYRPNGSYGRVLQISIRGLKDSSKTIRVALWNPKDEFLEIKVGHVIRLVDVRAKLLPHGELELHGNERTWFELVEEGKPILQEKHVFRVISIGNVKETQFGESLTTLVADKSGRLNSLVFRDKALNYVRRISPDMLISCIANQISSSTFICTGEIDTLLEDDSSIPSSKYYFKKVSELKDEKEPVVIEVIVLSKPNVQEVVTKEGESVAKGDVIVGDDTGEVRLVAWRGLIRLIEDLNPGEKVIVRGAIVKQGIDGSVFLQLRSYSSIERLSY